MPLLLQQPLDQEFKEDHSLDLLKIDTEGCELDILRGGKKLISNNHNLIIMMEWSIPQLKRFHKSPDDFIQWLKEQQFHFMSIMMKDGSLKAIQPDDLKNQKELIDIVISKAPLDIVS